jgi:O-antigen ligase
VGREYFISTFRCAEVAGLPVKGIRAGLVLILVFGVLAFGGVEVWAESLIEIGAAILLAAWAFLFFTDSELEIHGNPLYAPLFGFLAIGVFQLLFHLTAYPFLTRVELLKLSAYFIIFFLTVQSFRSSADLEGLAWVLIIFCFAVSLFGITQHFTSEGKIYWFRELAAGGDLFGPYVNRNDFAGFVELTLPVGLSLLVFRGVRRDLFPLVTVLTVVPVSAMLLAGSRGGILCLVFEVAILALLGRARRGADRPRVAPIAMVILAALALIAWVGVGKAIERLSTLPSKDVSISRRFSMSRGALHMFLDHPFAGTGVGAMVAAYPRYETHYDGLVVDHVHDDYVEALAETGLLGAICGVSFLWLLFREARKNFETDQSHFSRALHASAVVALAGLLLHSFVDFNLHIPGNALLFLLQAHIATSMPLPSNASSTTRSSSSR